MQKQSDEFLTIEEVAKIFRVAEATVYRMARKGEIPAIKFGRVWRIDYSKLKKQLDDKQKPEFSNEH